MLSQAAKADAFRKLHHQGRPLVLPNAWDVPSARIFEDSGFPAVATSSAGLMVSLGYEDGESIGRPEFLAAVGRISKVLHVPLSVDAVAGFGKEPDQVARMVKRIVKTGAIGVNIEDVEHRAKKLHSLSSQVKKLEAIKKLDKEVGFAPVINARTDAFRFYPGDEDTKLDEAIRRASAYKDAGADCVYPMGLAAAQDISRFVNALRFPVNVMVRKGLPPIGDLQKLGVARVSFGPSASYAAMGLLKRASEEVLQKGTYNLLLDGAITFDELNSLAVPKARTPRDD